MSVTALGRRHSDGPLPDIHFQDLGTGPEGITAGDLTKKVLAAIEQGAIQAASGAVADIGNGAVYLSKDAGGLGTNAVDSVTKGLGGFFKKK